MSDGQGQGEAGERATLSHESRLLSVTLIDDQPIILAGVAALIRGEPGLEVRDTASTLAEGIELIERQPPDVVVCDIQIGVESGFAILDRFPAGRPPIIFLSSHQHLAYYEAARDHGAAGYIAKGAVIDQLVDAIKVVAAGGRVFPAEAASAPGQKRRPAPPSKRELEVIKLLVEGRTNQHIAGALGISAKTVDSHLRILFDRYGAGSRTQLAMHALTEGWVRAAGGTIPSGEDRSGGRWVSEGAITRPPRRQR